MKGAGLALSLDFELDVAPRIQFLVDLGVHPDRLGHIFTQAGPGLLKTDLDALRTRVEYLQWKKFSKKAVVKIVSQCPQWLTYTVTDIDRYEKKKFWLFCIPSNVCFYLQETGLLSNVF